MSSNDLFSFLDEAPPEGDDIENGDAMEVEEKAEVFVPLHKRKADGISVALDSNNGQELEEQNDLPPSSKKPRLSSPKPVVLDDFETEAKREVDASAGLQGSAEPGTRLEIRHQVRVSFGWLYFSRPHSPPGSAPSSSTSWIQLHPHLQTCPPCKT